MSALTSLLVRDEVVSVHQIEDALSRQVLEGGEIDTALLELDAAPENTLNAYRAASFGLPAASRADLTEVARSVIELLPLALVHRHRVVPIGHHGHALVVACAQPLDSVSAREVTAQARGPVEWRVATPVRVEDALARHYGVDIAPRMKRLAEHIAQRPAGDMPIVTPAAVDILTSKPPAPRSPDPERDDEDEEEGAVRRPSAWPLPPPTIVTEYGSGPGAQPKRQVVSVAPVVAVHAATDDRSDEPTERVALSAPRVPREAEPITHSTPRPRVRKLASAPKGPITREAAGELLEHAEDRDEAIAAFFGYARQYFDSTALFTLREQHMHGLEAHNLPGVEDIHDVSLVLERGSALDAITRSLAPRVVDLMRRNEDRPLAMALDRATSQPCALIPVCIRQRVVSFVYGDRSGEVFHLDDIADLVDLLPALSQAFERIILVRKALAMRARRSSAPQPAKRESRPAPRASWSSAPPVAPAPQRPSPPPSAVAGVFPSKVPRPHEAQTPQERPRSMPPLASATHTIAGMPAAAGGKRTITSRDLQRVQSSVPPPPSSPRAAEARRALTTLGVPRSAPPPPQVPRETRSPVPQDDFERSPTVRLPTQSSDPPAMTPTAAAPRGAYSKPPPGAGTYRSEQGASSGDTRPIRRSQPAYRPLTEASTPDATEPQQALRGDSTKPPARASKVPPGTDGRYRSHDMPTERLGSQVPAPKPPQPAGRSSNPPSSYSSNQAQTDVVSLPRPPRVPSHPPAPGPSKSQPPRDSARPAPRRSVAPDSRRDTGSEPPEQDVVRVPGAVRASVQPTPTAAEPSIIVDMAAQLQQLVEDLCRCGPDDETRAVEALLRQGEAVLPVLAQHFPGPLWFNRKKPHPRMPMGRDVSAIARALSAFGERAWPHLATLLASWEADTRFYATLLVSDQVLPPLLPLLSERLFDADPQIRLIVKDTLPQYRSVPGFPEVMKRVRERAFDTKAAIQDRLAALDAIAALRDSQSVPQLIAACGDADKQISVPAHRALLVITAQDFGDAARKWSAWYDDHKDEHRVEWLIEGLMHAEQPVRATAGIELQKLTQVYYGYVAAAPKRDRERAQQRYRDWWRTQGRAKFAAGSL